MDELGWPIRNDEGEIVLSRIEMLRLIGRWTLLCLCAFTVYIGSLGWKIPRSTTSWPWHLLAGSIAAACFAVPAGFIARLFGRVITLLEAEDNATETLRVLRKAQEIEDRERHEQMKAWVERKDEHRRKGQEFARQRAERMRLLKSQQQIEDELGR